jgi:P27 family predicted phage terminase small subunit
MKSGPPPKPTALKVVGGNPGRRPINKEEPAPEIVAPHCPPHLAAEGVAEWERIMPLLIRYHIISEIDTAALALYCQSYARWQQAEAKISEIKLKTGDDGLLIKAPSGYPIQNPYLAIANRAMEDCYKYLQQFGLSPSARTRVIVSTQGDLFGNEKAQSKYFFA